MKKVFFSLFLAFTIVATAFAQEESEHLTFKGVPIDGTLNEYVTKMKQAGLLTLAHKMVLQFLKVILQGSKVVR